MLNYIKIFYQAAVNTIHHDGIEHAGYMSFMNFLSLFPFLIFIVSFAGFIGETRFGIDFINILLDNLPTYLISGIKPRIEEIVSGPPQGLLTLSILGAIWTSSSSVEGLRTILNRVYCIKNPPAYLLRRFLSIFQFLILSAIIILSMIILLILPMIYEILINFMSEEARKTITSLLYIDFFKPVWGMLRSLILFINLFLVVSLLFVLLPNAKITFKSVIPGSIIVVFLWILTGTVVASFIRSYEQVSIIYGRLGSIIIAMFFFYIINLTFIYGAEVNYLLKKN